MLTEGVERGHSAHRQAARTAAIVPRLMSANGSNCDAAYTDGNLPPHYELGALIE